MELFLAMAMAIHRQVQKLSNLCRETLREMTTNSTKVGTETCCHIVGDPHLTFRIKSNLHVDSKYKIPQNSLRIQTLWQKYGTNTSHSTAVTISFCHPSNVGETQGLRDALQEVKDASIISCRVHRSVTEGITTNLSSYSSWKVPMEM